MTVRDISEMLRQISRVNVSHQNNEKMSYKRVSGMSDSSV